MKSPSRKDLSAIKSRSCSRGDCVAMEFKTIRVARDKPTSCALEMAEAVTGDVQQSKQSQVIGDVHQHRNRDRLGDRADQRETHANNEQDRERRPGVGQLSLVDGRKHGRGYGDATDQTYLAVERREEKAA